MTDLQCECLNAVKSELGKLEVVYDYKLIDDDLINGAIIYYCFHGFDSKFIAKTLFDIAYTGCNNKSTIDTKPNI